MAWTDGWTANQHMPRASEISHVMKKRIGRLIEGGWAGAGWAGKVRRFFSSAAPDEGNVASIGLLLGSARESARLQQGI